MVGCSETDRKDATHVGSAASSQDSRSRRASTSTRRVAGQEQLLTPAALAFLADLHRRFEPARQARLAARRERQAVFDAGALPDFRADTARHPRRRLARRRPAGGAARPPRRDHRPGRPEDGHQRAQLRRAAATWPTSRIRPSPTWDNLLTGQRALRKAVAGTLDWMAPDGSKHYVLKPFDEQAVLMVRPRGWHLDEKHLLRRRRADVRVSLFDLGLFAFHNADALAAKDRGPYFYLPKLQSMEEAQLWDEVLAHIEARARPAAGPDQGHGADRDAAGGVRDGRDPARAARRASSASTAAAGTTSFPTSRPSARTATRCCPSAAQVTMTQPFLQGLFGTADPDLPPPRRARDGRHGRADPDRRRRRRQRRARWPACAPTSCAKSAPATTAPGSRIRR